MSKLTFPFLPKSTTSMKKLSLLFEYLQGWGESNGLGHSSKYIDVTFNANQSIPDNTSTDLVWDRILEDDDNVYDGTTGEYVCPTDGIYSFMTYLRYSMNDGDLALVFLRINNGSRSHRGSGDLTGAANSVILVHGNWSLKLIAGDRVKVVAHHISGGSISLIATAAQSEFIAYRERIL